MTYSNTCGGGDPLHMPAHPPRTMARPLGRDFRASHLEAIIANSMSSSGESLSCTEPPKVLPECIDISSSSWAARLRRTLVLWLAPPIMPVHSHGFWCSLLWSSSSSSASGGILRGHALRFSATLSLWEQAMCGSFRSARRIFPGVRSAAIRWIISPRM